MTELLKGKYAIDACIGRGGMAEVFAARTVGAAGFSQRVAIKRIHPVHGLDARFREMFIAEAQLSAHLRHGNLVRVFDFDEDEAGCLFLVMEYVDGVDLDGLLRTGLLPLPVILYVTGEILRGLAYVHELPVAEGGPRGLVHRDVSPQNVLLSWDGAVQVSDFGIAKARTATQAGASVLIKGKPAYMSPEQARGLSLDGRSDVFAVGIMLWEMLCGEPLFHDPSDMRATLAAVMFGDTPPPSTRARRPVPSDVDRLAMQMLQRDREARSDATAALAVLTACADYPRSGREVLAALLSERLPERAPRRGVPRLPRTEPPWERVTLLQPAEEGPRATVIAEPRGRLRPRLVRAPGSILTRARRRSLRRALLGAVTIGALIGAMLHVALGGGSSAAQNAPALPSPEPREMLERARGAGGPRIEAPPSAPGPGSAVAAPSLVGDAALRRGQADAAPRRGQADAPPPTSDAESPGIPAKIERSRRDGARRSAAGAARTPASDPVRPAAKGGMRIIDLRPETAETGATGGAPPGTRQIDLGAASEGR